MRRHRRLRDQAAAAGLGGDRGNAGRGRELRIPLIALMHWGDRYLAPDGPPLVVEHATCGGAVVEQLVCSGCGEPVAAHELRTRERTAAA